MQENNRPIEGKESQQKFSLLYLSPKFPATSMVFEQNEILGLIETGINLKVLSCRKAKSADLAEIHDFAKPILSITYFPNYSRALLGFLTILIHDPLALLRLLKVLLIAAKNPFSFPKSCYAMILALGWFTELRTERFDWIHADFGQSSATTALFLAIITRIPYSFKVHAFDIYDKRLRNRCELFSTKVKYASCIFTAHDYARNLLKSSYPEYSEKIITNYCSIRSLSSKRDDTSKMPFFAALGRLVFTKGFHVLLDATAILRTRYTSKFLVKIYGDGPQLNALMKKTEQLSITDTVKFHGRYENEMLPHILSGCMAVIVPSVMDKFGDMDGIPVVIYESMSLSVPVIASSISGIPEVVTDGVNGFLIGPDDASSLAEKMALLLEDLMLSKELGAQGRLRALVYHDYKLNAQSLLEAIRLHSTDG